VGRTAIPAQPAAAEPAAPPAAEQAPEKTSPAVAPGQVRNCLIVDDSRVMRRVSRSVVESLGFAAAEAEDGREALARCEAGMPDLILLDWNMPVMSGIEFIAALRAKPGGDKPMVVFCTTENDPAIIGKGVAAGADGFVTKPFDPATLQAKLVRLGAA
jgi:two-component system chemotaxis response regulator CheY